MQRLEFEKDELELELKKIKRGPEFEIFKILKTSRISKLECDCYRTHRSGNFCNSRILIIGPAVLYGETGEQLDCTDCSNRFQEREQGYRPRKRKFTVSSVGPSVSETDLLEIVQQLEIFNQ